MRKRIVMWRVIVVLVMAVTVVWLGACASAPESSEPETEAMFDGEAALQESCTRCHDLERTTSKQKTRDEWMQTVDRMIQKGAEVADKEALVDYLAENYGK